MNLVCAGFTMPPSSGDRSSVHLCCCFALPINFFFVCACFHPSFGFVWRRREFDSICDTVDCNFAALNRSPQAVRPSSAWRRLFPWCFCALSQPDGDLQIKVWRGRLKTGSTRPSWAFATDLPTCSLTTPKRKCERVVGMLHKCVFRVNEEEVESIMNVFSCIQIVCVFVVSVLV